MRRNELTPKQKRFALELVQSRTLTEAAQRAGISVSTAKRYKADPLVQRYIAELSHELLDALARRLRQLGIQAADVLEQAMAEGDSWSVRLKAADVTLQRLLQVTELAELEERVAKLEELVGGES
ncbi:MAG: terminase small subunit [Thermomicrobium sp.]|nr:terminase small subunit [Thermomicrobium sp.]MDW8007387.1 terminase small subunit [Thermomicrobium sp.]